MSLSPYVCLHVYLSVPLRSVGRHLFFLSAYLCFSVPVSFFLNSLFLWSSFFACMPASLSLSVCLCLSVPLSLYLSAALYICLSDSLTHFLPVSLIVVFFMFPVSPPFSGSLSFSVCLSRFISLSACVSLSPSIPVSLFCIYFCNYLCLPGSRSPCVIVSTGRV